MKNKTIMKRAFNWAKSENGILSILSLLVFITAIVYASSEMALAATVIAGIDNGKHVIGGPLTTDIVHQESDFLLNEIDKKIVKIRPMATPIDQLSRLGGTKHAGSMIVDFYSVDTKPTMTLVSEAYKCPDEDEADASSQKAKIRVVNPDMLEATETILLQGTIGYKEDGVTAEGDLVLYIVSKEEDGTLNVVAVNGKTVNGIENCVPDIDKATPVIRMGRAASELDIQTSQFESLPVKAQNYCQIFKMQIEQSTLQKIANKEVGWGFSDQEEAAIYDMRLGMEKNFLFGKKRKIFDYKKKENIMLTGGIWDQAGKSYSYSPNTLTHNIVVEMMREAFTGNAGNKRKVLIGGSGLIESLNKLEATKIIGATDEVVKWGIDFTEIRSKFGKFYVLLSEIFDECGMKNNGIVVDPEYIQKYSHVPFSAQPIDMKAAGIRNTDAIVLTEVCCIALRYPKAHMRIIGK